MVEVSVLALTEAIASHVDRGAEQLLVVAKSRKRAAFDSAQDGSYGAHPDVVESAGSRLPVTPVQPV
ncbi:MAG: hypothetical protein ACRDV9_07310 [Acidimicrobiia bacterium]